MDQNYITNRLIKETVDKNQKDYVPPEEENITPDPEEQNNQDDNNNQNDNQEEDEGPTVIEVSGAPIIESEDEF